MENERRKGEQAMKRMIAGMLALFMTGLVWTGKAYAADPDSDALTITISISGVDFGLDITTTGAAGQTSITLALGATGFMTIPSTVTILGNFGKQEVQVVGAALDTWQLDADTTTSHNDLQLYALFSGTQRSSAPVESNFDFTDSVNDNNLVTTSVKQAGEPNGAEDNAGNDSPYENAAVGPATAAQNDVDDLAIGSTRHLWLRMDAPATSSVAATPQKFVITLTALSGESS